MEALQIGTRHDDNHNLSTPQQKELAKRLKLHHDSKKPFHHVITLKRVHS